MLYFIIFVLLVWVWLISEWINAPLIKDNTDNNDSTAQSNDTNNKGI
jgi:hypothetical protein